MTLCGVSSHIAGHITHARAGRKGKKMIFPARLTGNLTICPHKNDFFHILGYAWGKVFQESL
ncbi:MAG: hypothetical protein LBM64_06950 [Deltaproteobacteria bacterium]|jgi:hypothetical protein|nr:hypothetical protein [Deltaproteobacteria bacterium]